MDFEVGGEAICKATGRIHKIIAIDPNGSVVLEQRLLKTRTTLSYAEFADAYRPNPHPAV